MHNNYSVNIACLCDKNFNKYLEEVKSFFTFQMSIIDPNFKNHQNSNFDAIIIDHEMLNKIPHNLMSLPKILINNKKNFKNINSQAKIIFKLPLNIIKFNREIIEFCKKNEFQKN